MASIYPVFFYLNNYQRALVGSPTSTSAISSITLRRGDNYPFYVTIVDNPAGSNASWDPLTTYGSIMFSAKADRDWDGTVVLPTIALTSTSGSSLGSLPGTNISTTVYQGNLDLSGTTLSGLFSVTNTAQVTLHAEFEWVDRVNGVTYRAASSRFNIVVQNDITKN